MIEMTQLVPGKTRVIVDPALDSRSRWMILHSACVVMDDVK